MRLFLAVRLTPAFQESLTETMDRLREQGVRGNYTLPENLHLTLAFLGESERLKDIHAAVREVELLPFEICAGELGSFRDVLWMGLRGEERLNELAEEVRGALRRRRIPFDEKPFKAHITLVRKPRGGAAAGVDIPNAAMVVSRISVMKSEWVDGVLRYTEV